MTAVNYDVPLFDPFRNPGEGLYLPDNLAADLLMRVQYAYEDIVALFSIVHSRKDWYEIRLLLKYAILEWCSLDNSLCELAQLVLKGAAGHPINGEDKATLRELYRTYLLSRKRNHTSLKRIRDKIAAHRDPMPLRDVAGLWASIEPALLIEVLKPVPPFFNFVKELNIYEWSLRQQTLEGDILSVVRPFRFEDIPACPEDGSTGSI